jgi:hypothetical protein
MVTQLQPWAQKIGEQSKSQSVGAYARVLGIGYNSALATQKKLAAPACWKDLIKPGWAGDVHITDPKESGTAYMAIAALTQIFGEDEAFKYLKAMYKAPAAAKKGRAQAETKSPVLRGLPSAGGGKGGAGKPGAAKTGVAKRRPSRNAMAGISFVGDDRCEARAARQSRSSRHAKERSTKSAGCRS